MRICLFVNPEKRAGRRIVKSLLSWVEERGFELLLEEEQGVRYGVEGVRWYKEDEPDKRLDLVVAAGGDGTLLYAVHKTSFSGVPVLGVHLGGGLGFLTETREEELFDVLEEIVGGVLTPERRMTLDAEISRSGRVRKVFKALNDVVINTGGVVKTIRLQLFIDERGINEYTSDGVIIATPTGSTGYSLSGGGAIVNPAVEAILITPICPHSLSARPVVIPPNEVVSIRIERNRRALFTVDGLEVEDLDFRDEIRIKRGTHDVSIYTPKKRCFYSVLREKLKWRGSLKKK
jgi:NAD+ kinase